MMYNYLLNTEHLRILSKVYSAIRDRDRGCNEGLLRAILHMEKGRPCDGTRSINVSLKILLKNNIR